MQPSTAPPATAPDDELAALAAGTAAAVLSHYRVVQVTGIDAGPWLHDLLTADVTSLAPGHARRSLLLDPTGHIRADVQVARDGDGWWLFQAPDQSDITAALAPYVLSSDVRLEDRTSTRRLVALPGASAGRAGTSPSVLGAGHDVLVGRDAGEEGRTVPGRVTVGLEAIEVHRIMTGRARMGVDFTSTSIPAEAGLDEAIDATKGCFLGQESVARVRNLGHPPRVLRHLRADGSVGTGERVLGPRGDAGVVTSAARVSSAGVGTVLLASVAWACRDAALRSAQGHELVTVGSSG
jgi:tRNA-modifying protein YgfZ